MQSKTEFVEFWVAIILLLIVVAIGITWRGYAEEALPVTGPKDGDYFVLKADCPLLILRRNPDWAYFKIKVPDDQKCENGVEKKWIRIDGGMIKSNVVPAQKQSVETEGSSVHLSDLNGLIFFQRLGQLLASVLAVFEKHTG